MLSGAKKKSVAKFQVGGPVNSAVPPQPQPGFGQANPSGAMGVAAPGTAYQPGRGPNLRVGY